MFDWRREAEILASRYGAERMKAAIEALSDAYRDGRNTKSLRLDEDLLVAAYLAVRFPATMAATLRAGQAIVEAIEQRAGDFKPKTLLDLGAGCGAACLALQEIWPTIDGITAIEQLPAMVRMGKQIAPDAMWKTARFEDLPSYAPHDIVVCSYSYAEGRSDSSLLEKAWAAAGRLLILVEAGTPRGFAVLREAREKLIALGAAIVAPCPSQAACPMSGEDWCHFSARLNRSALHRRLKGGALGYEDEKFSYLAAWRGDLLPGLPRVIRHPLIHPGRIDIELCTAPDRHRIVATKRNPALFRRARKIAWGDAMDPSAPDRAEFPAGNDSEPETEPDDRHGS